MRSDDHFLPAFAGVDDVGARLQLLRGRGEWLQVRRGWRRVAIAGHEAHGVGLYQAVGLGAGRRGAGLDKDLVDARVGDGDGLEALGNLALADFAEPLLARGAGGRRGVEIGDDALGEVELDVARV